MSEDVEDFWKAYEAETGEKVMAKSKPADAAVKRNALEARFDLKRLEVVGEAVPVLEDVRKQVNAIREDLATKREQPHS